VMCFFLLYLNKILGLKCADNMKSISYLKYLLVDSMASSCLGPTTWKQICASQDHRKSQESRARLADSSKACRKPRAYNCCFVFYVFLVAQHFFKRHVSVWKVVKDLTDTETQC